MSENLRFLDDGRNGDKSCRGVLLFSEVSGGFDIFVIDFIIVLK